MNKFKDLEEIIIKNTKKTGIVVDMYKVKNTYYYQVELDNNDVKEYSENELEKKANLT